MTPARARRWTRSTPASRCRRRSTRNTCSTVWPRSTHPNAVLSFTDPKKPALIVPADADGEIVSGLPLPDDADPDRHLTRPCSSRGSNSSTSGLIHRLAVEFEPGPNVLIGPNGIGKTNILEALGLRGHARQPPGRHRCSARPGRCTVGDHPVRGRARRAASCSSSWRSRPVGPIAPGSTAHRNDDPRDVLGALRMVLFAPEDLALVRGDPAERRRYLDDLLVARQPRFAGVRADYERVLKQRNALLRTAYLARKTGAGARDLSTLEVWDTHLAEHGAELLAGRLELCSTLGPYVAKAYAAVSAGKTSAAIHYRSALDEAGSLRRAEIVVHSKNGCSPPWSRPARRRSTVA